MDGVGEIVMESNEGGVNGVRESDESGPRVRAGAEPPDMGHEC